MKVIIAGGRDFDDFDLVENAMSPLRRRVRLDMEVVSGRAKGADRLGELWAEVYRVKVIQYPADWDQYGKAAGHKRNYAMARYADVLMAFWDGESRGTRNMIDTALREGLEIHVYRY